MNESFDDSKIGKVSKILTFSCVDGPGNRLVLFMQGCNYRCLSCHNPHTINHCNHCGECVAQCPTQALSLVAQGDKHKVHWEQDQCSQCDTCIDVCPYNASPKITDYKVSQMLVLIRKHAPFLSGITVSGGEATLQLPFVIELFKAIKADAQLSTLTCFIDSNGSLSEQGWQQVMPWLDGAMVDIKAWQNDTHQWLVGRDNHRVFHSLQLLQKHQKLQEIRLLHIPNKSDLLTEVDALAHYLQRFPDDVVIRVNAFQLHGVVGEATHWEVCDTAQLTQFSQQLQQRLGRPLLHSSIV